MTSTSAESQTHRPRKTERVVRAGAGILAHLGERSGMYDRSSVTLEIET